MIDRSPGAAAADLAPLLAQHTDEHDRARQLAPSVVEGLRDAGMLRLLVPKALGGSAVTPSAYIEVLITLARADAATAWVTMTASTSTLLAAYLPREIAATIWHGGRDPLLAGVFAPTGALDDDGRLRGRWAWASGCKHADWALVGALTTDRRHVVAAVPMTAATIIDTWDPLGLGGTGSHDLVIDGATPAATTSVFTGAPWCDEPLTRVPLFGLLALGVASVGLGIARGALDHLADRLRRAEREAASSALATYAQLDARWRAAQTLADAVARDASDEAHRGPVSPTRRGELRSVASHAAREAAAIVRAAFHTVGGGAVGRRSPLARALADVEVMLTHRMVSDRVAPATGRALLGIGALPPDL